MQLDGRRVLVTGGAGFIGSNLVDSLLAHGAHVRVADDFSVGAEHNLVRAKELGAEIVTANVTDQASMAGAVEGIEVVMHLACSCLRVSLGDPWASDRVNALGTLTVLDAAAHAGVERFLYCSSSEVYGTAIQDPMDEHHPTRPTTVYGASKLAGEAYALAYLDTHALPVSIVRPFNTYGYREHVSGPSGEVIPKMTLRALAGRAPIILGDGEQTRDFTFVSDTVNGLIAAAKCDALIGNAVNIAYGREVSIARIAELVCKACDTDVEPRHARARPADVRRHCASIDRARKLFSYRPEVAIEEGIERYVAYFREHHGDELEGLLADDREQNWVGAHE